MDNIPVICVLINHKSALLTDKILIFLHGVPTCLQSQSQSNRFSCAWSTIDDKLITTDT